MAMTVYDLAYGSFGDSELIGYCHLGNAAPNTFGFYFGNFAIGEIPPIPVTLRVLDDPHSLVS